MTQQSTKKTIKVFRIILPCKEGFLRSLQCQISPDFTVGDATEIAAKKGLGDQFQALIDISTRFELLVINLVGSGLPFKEGTKLSVNNGKLIYSIVNIEYHFFEDDFVVVRVFLNHSN